MYLPRFVTSCEHSPVIVLSGAWHEDLTALLASVGILPRLHFLMQALEKLHLFLVLELLILNRAHSLWRLSRGCVCIAGRQKHRVLPWRPLSKRAKTLAILCRLQHISSLYILDVIIGGSAEHLRSLTISRVVILHLLLPLLGDLLLSAPVGLWFLPGLVAARECVLRPVDVDPRLDRLELVLVHRLVAGLGGDAVLRDKVPVLLKDLWLLGVVRRGRGQRQHQRSLRFRLAHLQVLLNWLLETHPLQSALNRVHAAAYHLVVQCKNLSRREILLWI